MLFHALNAVRVSGQLHEACTRDPLGQITRSVDVRDGVAAAVEHQRRDSDRGQDVPDIDLPVHLFVGCDCGRASRCPEHAPHRLELLWGKILLTGTGAADVPLRGPIAPAVLDQLPMLLF